MTSQRCRFLIPAAAALAVMILPASSQAERERLFSGDAPVTVYVIQADNGIKYSMAEPRLRRSARAGCSPVRQWPLATFDANNGRGRIAAAFGRPLPARPGDKDTQARAASQRRFHAKVPLDKATGFRDPDGH